jgi:hypothetical protein
VIAASSSSSSSAESSEPRSRGRAQSDSSSARPQSYIVTPVSSERGAELSAIEAVRKLIV